MKISLLVGAALALAATASSASAQRTAARPQQAPPLRYVTPFPTLHDPSAPNDPYRAAALNRRVWTEALTRQALADQPSVRVQRAYRVGALIDQGLCGPAAQLALAEHDAAMAARVPESCAAQKAGRSS